MIEKYDATVYAFDPTPRAIAFIEKQNLPKEKFKFFPFGLEAFDGETEFVLPLDDNPEPSGNVFNASKRVNKREGEQIVVQMRRLSTLMELTGVDKIDILKMDIEGSEFSVIEDILDSEVKFEQLCVEFHERFFSDGKEKMQKAITQLNAHGYSICAISPSYMEVTFKK
jgi:FkbM family methyltransferase